MSEITELRTILFPNTLLATTNAVLSENLQLTGFPISAEVTAIPVTEFMYSLTYSNIASFDQDAIRALTVTSFVIVEGILLKVESDSTVKVIGEGLHNLTANGGETFILLPDQLFTVEIAGETITISDAEAMIDLSVLPNITAGMLVAFDQYSISTYTQVSYMTFPQWVGLGGSSEYDLYEETMLAAQAASQVFWENL